MNLTNLKGVSLFFIVQADGSEESKETITDEKEFTNLQDALKLMKESEAPVKYLKFHHEGLVYKLYPTSESNEYRVTTYPIMN